MLPRGDIMKFSMTEIKKNAFNGPVEFEGTVDVSELEALNNDIRKIDPVQVEGICAVDEDELIFTFTIKGKMILPCARTLVDVSYPLDLQVTEVFTTSPVIDLEKEKEEVHQILEETLDLTPYIKENIVLGTPYRVFSDKKPLEEGEGWTFRLEDTFKEEQKEKIDPRFAKLQKLLDEDPDKRK